MYDNTDEQAATLLAGAMEQTEAYYRERGIFGDRFGFGNRPAIVVIDFAYGWTDPAYAGGTDRLDPPIAATQRLLDAGRKRSVPIVYTTSPYRPVGSDPMFKSAADASAGFRLWDERACQIDDRVAPATGELLIEKENASAFFGTHLISYLVHHQIDTLLITGCSTSACVRSTATDAKSYRLRPIIVRDCVGDRSAAAHVWTLFDIEARFADVVTLEETLDYLTGVGK